MVYDALPLTMTRNATDHDKFQIAFPSSAVEWEAGDPQRLTASVALLVESFDRKGKNLTHKMLIEKIGMRESAVPLVAAGPMVVLDATVPTGFPTARIRFVVRINRSGKLGADNFYLVDKKTLNDPSVAR
jgi:hypothetical protein